MSLFISGQAAPKQRGDVGTTEAMQDKEMESEPEEAANVAHPARQDSERLEPRRSLRVRRANTFVNGPEWA